MMAYLIEPTELYQDARAILKRRTHKGCKVDDHREIDGTDTVATCNGELATARLGARLCVVTMEYAAGTV